MSTSDPPAGATAAGAAGPLPMPGGELDLSLADTADAYFARPATAAAGPACQSAKAYVDHIQAGQYDKVVDLFAPDAVLMEPTHRTLRVGRDQIDDFFRHVIGKSRPAIVAVSYVGEGADCFVELAVRMSVKGESRYVLTSVDHFTTDDRGAITRMIAFARPMGASLGMPKTD